MRVIAGKYRRRRLDSLPGDETRPMLDRMRETLFNVIQREVEGRVFADLYAGTGAVGIEALSRGARRAVFVESNSKAAAVIESNLERVGAAGDASVIIRPVAEALPEIEADVWFLGPPYPAVEEYPGTLGALAGRELVMAVAQHPSKMELAEGFGDLRLADRRVMGANAFSVYRVHK